VPENVRANEVSMALSRAREVLRLFTPEQVLKGIWLSPMGKTLLATRIASEIPQPRVYVEPFAGGAQVLFAKDPSEIEVVSDLDPEIAFAFKFALGVTQEQLEILKAKKWVGDKAHFKKLIDSPIPKDPVERFYRFAYLSRFSFNKLRRGTMPDKNVGATARLVERLEKLAPRLKNIKARSADYERIIQEYDGPDTFFFLDPPLEVPPDFGKTSTKIEPLYDLSIHSQNEEPRGINQIVPPMSFSHFQGKVGTIIRPNLRMNSRPHTWPCYSLEKLSRRQVIMKVRVQEILHRTDVLEENSDAETRYSAHSP